MAVFLWTRGWNWTKGKLQLNSATQNITCSGATTATVSLTPAGSIPIGATVKVTTLITGATSFGVGDGTTATRWGATIAVTANTKTSSASYTSRAIGGGNGEVTLTANGSNFTAGVVEVTMWYFTLSHP